MRVYLLYPHAAHRHAPIGIYADRKSAEKAMEICETVNDGHHTLCISEYELGAPARAGLDKMQLWVGEHPVASLLDAAWVKLLNHYDGGKDGQG